MLRVLNAASGKSFLIEIHFSTWIMSNRFDSGFSIGLMRKEVCLAQAMAADAGVFLTLTSETARLWAEGTWTFTDTDDFTRKSAFADTDNQTSKRVASSG